MSGEMTELVRKYKQKLERKKLDKSAFVEEQRLLTTLGSKRWDELRQLIKNHLDEFNTEMDYEALSWDDPHSERISITRKEDGVKLECGYEEAVRTAFFRSPQTNIDLTLTQVVRGGDVVFISINQNTKVEFVNAPK